LVTERDPARTRNDVTSEEDRIQFVELTAEATCGKDMLLNLV